MNSGQQSSVAIDLTRLHPRTVTSFYSNLVTRPTGRAVRLGVEQQLVELARLGQPCLSILDFSQVRIMDYSCADEIVAKLLLGEVEARRDVQVFFIARGLQDHHLEAVEAVLDRHQLLLAAEEIGGAVQLLGPRSPIEDACWTVLAKRGRASAYEMAATTGAGMDSVRGALLRFVGCRVAVDLRDGRVCAVSHLSRD